MSSARQLLAKQAQRVAANPSGDIIPSPCISVCRMDSQGELCLGCLRTLDEIAAWDRMGDEEKREVWAGIANRITQEGTP